MRSILNDKLIYEVLSVVAEIPQGRVATYGQIARLIGRERNARLVGRVLAMSHWYGSYPCHRVVNHAGRLVPGWSEQGGRASFSRKTAVWTWPCTNGVADGLRPPPRRASRQKERTPAIRRSPLLLAFTVSPPEVTRPICPLPPGQIR